MRCSGGNQIEKTNRVYIVVTPFFPSPASWRGAYCLDFVKALIRDGRYDVRVFVPGKGPDYEIEGVCVHRFPVRMLPSNVFPFMFRAANARSFLQRVVQCGIRLEDVVFCHGHTANFAIYPLALKKANPQCRTLLHHHDLQSFGLGLGALSSCWIYNLIQFPILRHLHEQIDCHVFISEAVRNSFLRAPNARWTDYEPYRRQMRWLPYRSVRIHDSYVLHNGVDSKLFYPKRQVARDSTKPVIGCVGNFVPLKDQMTLLRAVQALSKEIPEIRIIFVGSGPEREKCEQFAKANGILAEFRDEVSHDALLRFYNLIDIFVLPSRFEGFGCVFTEAAACGVPFVACKGQGTDDLIRPEESDKWLIRPGDVESLVRILTRFFRERPAQTLAAPIRIDELVVGFVDHLEAKLV